MNAYKLKWNGTFGHFVSSSRPVGFYLLAEGAYIPSDGGAEQTQSLLSMQKKSEQIFLKGRRGGGSNAPKCPKSQLSSNRAFPRIICCFLVPEGFPTEQKAFAKWHNKLMIA